LEIIICLLAEEKDKFTIISHSHQIKDYFIDILYARLVEKGNRVIGYIIE
jgi:hypothetical protein